MTVSSTTNRKTYTGNGVTTSFSTSPVVFFDTSDLTVYVVVTATGVSETLVENTHYTVSGGDGAVGTVNLAGGSSPYGAPLSTQKVVIVRSVPATQETDFANNDTSDAEVVEDALDRLTMLAQQNATRMERSLRQPDEDPTDIGDLPNSVDRASLYLAFDANGDPVATAGTTSSYVVTPFMETVLDDTTAAAARSTLGASATTPADDVFRVVGSADATKKLAFEVDGITTATTRTATAPDYNFRFGNLPAGIGPLPYAGSSIPTGWLECDGSAVSRTTYADLFAAISTTWGVGNGSTTFNLPDMRGKVAIGSGTGTTTEAVTASSSNGFTVTSNSTKWITGMTVVLSNLSGFTTSASAGPTYYAVRISDTNVRLATTLALAQTGAPDVTLSGTGTATLTNTYTARTLGQYGGEESHAMSSTEILAHVHSDQIGGSPSGSAGVQFLGNSGGSTGSYGGNAAMNNMQPFAVVKYIISY